MRKSLIFYCFLASICFQNFSFANASSCHSVFISGSKSFNITHLRSEKINLLTKDKEANLGFDLAYFYGLSERIYLGIGVGYFSSASSLFNKKSKQSDDHTNISLKGDFLKIPVAIRFYGDEFASILRIYLYGDLHCFFNLGTNAIGDEDNVIFSQSNFDGDKISCGTTVGAGVNVCLTQCSNIFIECLFALRPFSAIKMKSNNEEGNLKINSLMINFGAHLDFVGSDDVEKIE